MAEEGPSRRRRQKEPLIITVPRGLLRRSLRQIIPGKNSRISFIINGADIRLFSPSEISHYDLSHVQHLPYHFSGFRDLRSPSPPFAFLYEFPMLRHRGLPQYPICPPLHGRYPPTPLSPRYTINPINQPPPDNIYVSPDKRLQKRKVMSKLAKRRGVMIDPLSGKMKIVKQRTHADIRKF